MPKRKLYEAFNEALEADLKAIRGAHTEDYQPEALIFGFIIGLVIAGCFIALLVGF